MKRTLGERLKLQWVATLGGALLFAGSLLGFAVLPRTQNAASAATFQLEAPPQTGIQHEGKILTSFAPLVKLAAPSVVKISVTVQAKQMSSQIPDMPDEFRRFFGGRDNGTGSSRQHSAPKQHGVGSGVIVTSDGYILTNNHVVENATAIQVETTDGRTFSGKVIGLDPKTDVAVIKIEANDLPHLPLADSDKIETGDVVLAIGNPFGIGQTVTTGIVSAKGRATMGLDYEDFIQTDAAINPGNSGGALIDTDGHLVGINTAILSESGGNQGIGFAVPANLARWVMNSLLKNGHVERGFLGVNIQELTPQLAKQFNLKQTQGALVSEVTPNSPADKAGLKSGDVIVEFNGNTLTDSRHLRLQVAETVPGISVPMKVIRDGASKMLSITVKEMPADQVAKGPSINKETANDALHGVEVTDLDSSSRAHLQVPARIQGALISQVDPDSASFEAGLREGDVITEIDRKPVINAEQAVAACAKPTGKKTLLQVWSHGSKRYVVVDETQAG